MSLELKGHISQILPMVTGEGWSKRDFLIDTGGDYPKTVCFTVWKDKTTLLEKAAEGQEVTVHFNAESKEYNNRWHTNLTAWKIEFGEKPVAESKAKEDLPF